MPGSPKPVAVVRTSVGQRSEALLDVTGEAGAVSAGGLVALAPAARAKPTTAGPKGPMTIVAATSPTAAPAAAAAAGAATAATVAPAAATTAASTAEGGAVKEPGIGHWVVHRPLGQAAAAAATTLVPAPLEAAAARGGGGGGQGGHKVPGELEDSQGY